MWGVFGLFVDGDLAIAAFQVDDAGIVFQHLVMRLVLLEQALAEHRGVAEAGNALMQAFVAHLGIAAHL